jgi:CheY-like chemotaxis protein/two-component sensor histidine kinase
MAQLTTQLLAYARGGKYQARIISLSDFVTDSLPLVTHILKPTIRVETNLPRNILSVNADLTQLQLVLSAILSNASEAIEGEGWIRISTKEEEVSDVHAKEHPGLKAGRYVCLIVEDDGKGMDVDTMRRVFEPFFTTKFQGRGLGMAAVYGIVKNHEGWISLDSELGKGTVVQIYFPAVEAGKKEEKTPEIEPAKRTATILVVEDEEMVMDVSRRVLERLGYRVLEAKRGKEAIEIARTFDGDIDLAILDIKLPDMGGQRVYPLLMEARPNLKVLVCSGYSIEGPAQAIMDAGAQGFIQKPFSIATVSEKLKEVLG